MPVTIRLPFEYYGRYTLLCEDVSRTKQSFRDECDFNNVMNRWATSGLVTHLNPREPIYADVSSLGDYQSSIELIRSAQSMFRSLPSALRDRFDNDPSKLLAFISDPANEAEARKLGILRPLPPSVDGSASPIAKDEPSTEPPTAAPPQAV